ncbi:hypothetical protein C8R45DRAFT_1083360 [Mycena sanguinolenta]|nr:hypothetical protein C8R45DRAFT_1083360 [Mycena sanguinolenta]
MWPPLGYLVSEIISIAAVLGNVLSPRRLPPLLSPPLPMDDLWRSDPEFTHSTTCDPEPPSSGSGMFSHSQKFTVTGKNFTHITNNYPAPNVPSNLRMIPLGDIDLRHEIRVDPGTGISNSKRGQACVRRMHSAKARIDGRKSRVTVAMYQGNGAEEEWRQDIAKYMSMRHPNIIQISGAATSGGIHATLFTDDLIPLRHFLDHYLNSHFSTVYIHACGNEDFTAAHNYVDSEFQLRLWPTECRKWIRRSTGRLCTELTQTKDDSELWLDPVSSVWGILSPSTFHMEPSLRDIVKSLSLEQYHFICGWNLARYRRVVISASTTMNLGGVRHDSGHSLEDSAEIALLSSVETSHSSGWTSAVECSKEMLNGWTRFPSGNLQSTGFFMVISSALNPGCWLSRANNIFRSLHIMSNFEDYVYLDRIKFRLSISETTEDPPPGFLFLCPKEDFRSGPSSCCCPSCVGYWSLDPSGVDRLSPEEATQLGFPTFELAAEAVGYYWDDSVYEGLRQFHRAKGFDPYSQDVARHLGLPLYQLFPQDDICFVHMDGDDVDAAYPANYESENSHTSISHVDAESHLGNARDPVNGEDMPTLSGPWKFLMTIKLVLILFTLSAVYAHF